MDFDPFSDDYFVDPYPIYRHLRDEQPVYRNEALGFFALSRFRDVLAASIDHASFTSTRGVMIQESPRELVEAVPMMIMMDPPRQTRLRKLISKVFTPKAIGELEPRIRELARRLLDPLAERGSCDILTEFAAVLPIEVISELLGVPAADRVQVREWSDLALTREVGNPEIPAAAHQAMAESLGYFKDLIDERKKRPREDMISHFIAVEMAADEGGTTRLSDAEILGFTALISTAGNETVTKLLGNAMVLLHRNPEQRAKLVANPGLIADAVEESLRYWPPSQIQGRSTTCDVALHGRTIPAGSRVLLLTGAACRDEREFANADDFDIERRIPIQLALGHGAHKCLGAALARIESRVSLEEVFARFPDYVVDEERTERVQMSNVAGYASVPISYPPRAR